MIPDPVVSEEARLGWREPPLAGIRVLDLSRVLAGPYATMIMGDLGAEVIKVERPGRGDDTREWGPPFVGPDGRRESTYFLSTNRNKRSIELDLKDSGDAEVLRRMAGWADVLVENFRVGVMDRLGLDPGALKRLNPRLVVLSITGFGSSGPDRDRVAYDQIVQGEGGLMSITGEPSGRPLRVGVPIADLTAGMYGVIGVLAALRERDHSGSGQRVETSLLAGQIAIHSFQGTRYLVGGEVPGPSGNDHPTVAPYGAFQAADAQLILAVGNESTWRRFAELLGIPSDTGPYVGNQNRVARREELRALIEERLAGRRAADWVDLFAANGVPAGEVRTLDRVYASEQVREQGLVLQTDHPTLGTISLSGSPLRFSGSALAPPAPPPTLGEHSDELRAQFTPKVGADAVSAEAEAAARQSSSVLEAVRDLVDDFRPLEGQACAGDPLEWPGYPEQLERARQRTGDEQSVTVGRAAVDECPCVLVAFNFAFIGGSMGEAEGERITSAITLAMSERLPLVTVLRSGGARMQEGMRALIQMQRVAGHLAQLSAAGIPHISVLRHPTTGGVWASVGAGADVILAEQGAAVAFAGSRIREQPDDDVLFRAEGKLEHGFVDAVLPAPELRGRLALALRLLAPASRGETAPPPLPEALSNGNPGSGWSQVRRAREPKRPSGDDYLADYFSNILEIRGDRVGGADPCVRCGFGRHDGRTIAFVSQSGEPTSAAGYRTASRLVRLADALGLPVITLIDSPGADGSAAGEVVGVGSAVAMLLRAIAEARVPMLSVTIGQGGSGGSLALAAPSNLWITSDGYFSVINPELAAAILKRSPEEIPLVADQLRLGPEDLERLRIVRGVLR